LTDTLLPLLDGSTAAVILAAGRGIRMRSSLPKVLHRVGGVPMFLRALDAVRAAGIQRAVLVVPPDSAELRALMPDGIELAEQAKPMGTGDAVHAGVDRLNGEVRRVVVVGGDTPLIGPDTIRAVVDAVPEATVSVGVTEIDDPTGYGRVITDGDRVMRVVEEADASDEERRVHLVNGMLWAFDADWLRAALDRLQPSRSGELYLTALMEEATNQGSLVEAVRLADPWEVRGVNTRRELAEAEAALQDRIRNRLLDAGVTLVDPNTTFVDESVVVESDAVIHPQSYLRGGTKIAARAVIGPGAEIIDSSIGSGTRVWWSVVEGATVGARVTIGPYCRLRPGAVLDDDVALGSFGEVKNSRLGSGTQMHHFSYVGDAQVGKNVNIGAGAVTCNFDGVDKHQTVIGDGSFIGSDTMLVAPVELGDGALTGAGSVVTRSVPAGGRVAGVPARAIPGRAKREASGQAERK
jgi:bifunctional UDP-N-acetylglucosamine pyrophosphorylase/glucosamine-1-phosphate N-acetyltransferase